MPSPAIPRRRFLFQLAGAAGSALLADRALSATQRFAFRKFHRMGDNDAARVTCRRDRLPEGDRAS